MKSAVEEDKNFPIPARDGRTAAVAVYWAGELVFETLVAPGASRREVLHAVDRKLALGPSRPRALGTTAFMIASVEPGCHGYAYVVSLATEAEGLR